MATVLVDANVLLDILTSDAEWEPWSAAALAEAAEAHLLAINPIIYAEISIGFGTVDELESALPPELEREPLPWNAGFLAGKAFRSYRQRGGARRAPLPDFYIGAHAQVRGHTLLTRDARRFRTYFPDLALIAP